MGLGRLGWEDHIKLGALGWKVGPGWENGSGLGERTRLGGPGWAETGEDDFGLRGLDIVSDRIGWTLFWIRE